MLRDQPIQARCAHLWPGDLADDVDCESCGLPYAEWDDAPGGANPAPYHTPVPPGTSLRAAA
jgi:hypothetical protein